jgi:mono/diheme cytochrome c family protein
MRTARLLGLLALAGPLWARQADPKQGPAVIAEPGRVGIGRTYTHSALPPLLENAKALVVAFSVPDCPVSRLYKPKLERWSRDYQARGVRILVVAADDRVFGPLFEPERSTETFLLDSKGTLRYRGAVDDQYGVGYQRDQPTRNFLADAIDAVLSGKSPPVAATEAPGCRVERAAGAGSGAPPPGKPVFHKDVEPIFQKHCVVCHRPGEIGPFSLLKYEKAKAQSRQIREVVVQRRMPPWHADPRVGSWKNDRRLSELEVATIAAWVDAGAPEGDGKQAPPPRVFPEGWQIGTPDVIFKIPRPEKIPAEGTIPYRHALVRTGLKEDTWVQAIEVRPSAREVVHHVLVFVQYPLQRLKEQPPIDGGLLNGYFGIMVPGESPMVFPEGMGKKIPAGALLVFQIHYTATGTEAQDQTSIGLVFSKKPPKQEVVTRGIVNQRIRIPPGEADHEEVATFEFAEDARVLSFLPHMHVRGRSFRYVALHPDGTEEILLDVPKYDFNWQTCYRFAEPRVFKKGTKIRAVAHFDNSKANPANPDPTKEVRFGQQTWEEMLIGYMDFVREP